MSNRSQKSKKIADVIEGLSEGIESLENPESLNEFKDFPLTLETKKGLNEAGFTHPSSIQKLAIVSALKGEDVLCAAKTGSGKTLAFIVPMLEKLYLNRWSKHDGLGALVISPTRELAFQIFETLTKVGKYHDFSAGVIFGGKSLKEEAKCIAGTNIIICTPGRLLQHMDETFGFDASGILMLVLDEADRILDLGFSTTMRAIMENLSVGQRQTLLYSATQTRMVSNLVDLSLKDPVFVEGEQETDVSTPLRLKQVFTLLPDHEKLNFIVAFIRTHESKIIVFLHTCKQVMFFYMLLQRMRLPTPILGLCGRMGQRRRLRIYEKFREKEIVALFATDVAARGLDFPNVEWVIQLDCPLDVDTYIHRVGRTARYERSGKSALIITPSQTKILEGLHEKKIPIKESPLENEQIADVSKKIRVILDANEELKVRAKRALRVYVKAIHKCANKELFDSKSIDVAALAKSYGIEAPVRVKIAGVEKRIEQTLTEQKKPAEKRRPSAGAEKITKFRKKETSEQTKDDNGWFEVTQFDDL